MCSVIGRLYGLRLWLLLGFLQALQRLSDSRVNGWMETCDFTSVLTVFQSYQDDDRLIMKGCVQWNPVYG